MLRYTIYSESNVMSLDIPLTMTSGSQITLMTTKFRGTIMDHFLNFVISTTKYSQEMNSKK